MDNVLRVKLFGEAFRLYKLETGSSSITEFLITANFFKEPLHRAILNVDFFEKLKMPRFQSLKDIAKYRFGGLINNNVNQIEIYCGRKRLAKFKLEELIRQQTLFPLYNIKMTSIPTENLIDGIYVVEVEIGLIGIYEIKVREFQIELLKFHLADLKVQNLSYELLVSMYYEDRKLVLVKSDTLLRSQNSFEKL